MNTVGWLRIRNDPAEGRNTEMLVVPLPSKSAGGGKVAIGNEAVTILGLTPPPPKDTVATDRATSGAPTGRPRPWHRS